VVTAGEARGLPPLSDGRTGRAEVVREGDALDIRAEGPGILVVTEAWDLGWSAEVDGAHTPIVRVNQAEMGVAVGPGTHRVVFSYRSPGLIVGLLFAAAAALGLALALTRNEREARG
jgi:uncharacterized membrane protein YfhO